ncbi:hypothetical protein EMIT0111MI5_130062 [Burkholderia sp. IT-111MI5]
MPPARAALRPTMHTSRLNWFYPGLIFAPETWLNRALELSPCIPLRVNPYPAYRCKQRLYRH